MGTNPSDQFRALRQIAEQAKQLQVSPMLEEYRAMAKQLQASRVRRNLAQVTFPEQFTLIDHAGQGVAEPFLSATPSTEGIR